MSSLEATLTKLCTAFGPSGHEFLGVSGTIEELVRPLVDELSTDALGDLICTRRNIPGSKRVMLAAHMDQCALMVTAIDDDGFLRITPLGGLTPSRFFHRQVVFPGGLQGVACCEPLEKGAEAEMKHLYIDIGASSKEEAGKLVSIADVCVYAPYVLRLGGDLMCATAMDDRVGCAVLIETLRQLSGTPLEITALFSTQEELGLRGAAVSAYGAKPDMAVALDVCPTGDAPGDRRLGIKLGAGPALKVMDAHSVSNVELRKAMERQAHELDLPVQLEILPYGGTDAAAIQRSRSGVPAATLSIPCRNVHSATEIVSLRDAARAVQLLTSALSAGGELT